MGQAVITFFKGFRPIKMVGREIKPYREAEFIEFAQFCSFPKQERDEVFGFHTFVDFAKKNGLEADTLTLWRKEDVFWKLVEQNRKKWFREKTPEVLLALYRTILKKGQANEVGLWLRYVEEWSEKLNIPNPIGVNVGNVNINLKVAEAIDNLPPEDKAKIVQALEAAVKEDAG